MGSSPERSNQQFNFSDVLHNVMSDSNFLVGSEPEGSNWDFSDWPGNNFREFGGWVLSEKYFSIATIDNRLLDLRIIQTDPQQFPVENTKVEFVIAPVKAKGFPTILIGKGVVGDEKILRNSREPIEMHQVPEYFQGLAQEVGVLETSDVVSDDQGSQWALFLKNVLEAKRVLPSHYTPTDFMVRDQLELGPNENYSERDKLLVGMMVAEQELLMIAYADFVLTI